MVRVDAKGCRVRVLQRFTRSHVLAMLINIPWVMSTIAYMQESLLSGTKQDTSTTGRLCF
jgi:hypothetical protein